MEEERVEMVKDPGSHLIHRKIMHDKSKTGNVTYFETLEVNRKKSSQYMISVPFRSSAWEVGRSCGAVPAFGVQGLRDLQKGKQNSGLA